VLSAAATVSFAAGLPARGLSGNYMEARTADVYTGPCFANGEVEINGKEAVFGWKIDSPLDKYLFVLCVLTVFTLLARNLVRGRIGREWMAIRDMDVAAEVIGIRPVYAKLTAFAVSSFYVGVAGALWGFVQLGAWEPLAFDLNLSLNLLFMIIIVVMIMIMSMSVIMVMTSST